MSKWRALLWIILLLVSSEYLHWLGVESAHDLFGLISTTFLIVLIWSRLGGEGNLRPFLIGISCYWLASLLDWSEVYLPYPKIIDEIENVLYITGFFLIGVSFLNVMLAQKKLQKQLYDQAYTDELTKLGNRRALFTSLEEKISNKSGVVLYIDVNDFKVVNDQFGHETGDLVLRECAFLLQSSEGTAYRIGGDEFVLLKDNSDLAHVEGVLENLHARVKPLTAQYGISLSIGTAFFSPSLSWTPDSLLTKADSQMYQAKKKHRSSLR